MKLRELSLETSPDVTAAYADLSNDFNPLHVDAVFAAKTPFGAPVAHGAMALDLLLNAIEATFGTSGRQHLDIRFTAPVKVGERITTGGVPAGDGWSVWVHQDDGTQVLKGTLRLGGPE
ncbi:MaoC family dehydratase [Chachezhania sediminis]|uniref:MaoC family dehydratase n=1 Tax=Chachezhania sediminis TaxID=2599291 RepID=UPI00131D7E5D|nr:MaoC family dehydratase [Chachezhania sediminis]